jgi:hypothetical protein
MLGTSGIDRSRGSLILLLDRAVADLLVACDHDEAPAPDDLEPDVVFGLPRNFGQVRVAGVHDVTVE